MNPADYSTGPRHTDAFSLIEASVRHILLVPMVPGALARPLPESRGGVPHGIEGCNGGCPIRTVPGGDGRRDQATPT